MTKKDFIALADAIREANAGTPPEVQFTDWHIRRLADFCASENPQFNRSRWLDYIAGKCGKNGGKVAALPTCRDCDCTPSEADQQP